jgi:AcrR family transcriptional regulator
MSSETADRILEAACELIAEDGIDEVRIARVAQRAGASTSLVHHYFSTREELLEQALIHSFEQAGDERFGAEVAAGGAVEGLAAAIRESLYDRYRRWMAEVISAGVESGDFPAGTDVDGVADLGVALLDGAGVRALLGDPRMDVDAARRLIAGALATRLAIEPARLLAEPRS